MKKIITTGEIENEINGNIIAIYKKSTYDIVCFFKRINSYMISNIKLKDNSEKLFIETINEFNDLEDFIEHIELSEYRKSTVYSKYSKNKPWSIIFEELREKEGFMKIFG